MALWLNHVAVAAPRNATTSHTVNPAAGTVVSGASFTPTAGRLLVCVVAGPVTSSTPSGWTLPSGGSAIDNTGLYVWHRTAAGSDTITTSHGSSSNFPVLFHFFEFPTGSTFVGSAAQATTADNGPGPTLSGLTGTNLPIGVMCQGINGTAGTTTWGSGTPLTDFGVDAVPTDGYQYSAVYTEDSAASSAAFTADSTVSSSQERLVFAVNVGVDPNATITAVRAQGAGALLPPTVSTSSTVTINAVRAQGSGAMQPAAVSTTVAASGGGPMVGTGALLPPTVSATSAGSVTVNAVRAQGSGAMQAPIATATAATGVTINAVRAQGTGAIRAPGVNLVATLPANISLGRVTARFGTAQVLAGDVDGIADFYPITDATITFTSTAPVLLNDSASPAPVIILPKPIICSLDSNGYLVDEAGHRWVDLIATDDTDLRPVQRKWKVTFTGSLQGLTATDMIVPSNGNVDLVSIIAI